MNFMHFRFFFSSKSIGQNLKCIYENVMSLHLHLDAINEIPVTKQHCAISAHNFNSFILSDTEIKLSVLF